MKTIIYKVHFFSDWHCGSGISSGAQADTLVIKDTNNFPFIPGKTMKGLFKDGAQLLEQLGGCKEKLVQTVFGTEKTANDQHPENHEGSAWFSNATLSRYLQRKLANQNKSLYRFFSATAIDRDGLAKDHSLRRIETTVPLCLYGEISGIPSEFEEDMKRVTGMVKRLGTGRNRGLGRCDIAVMEVRNENTEI